VQILWCAASVVLGLLLALVLDASPATATLGWVVAGFGVLGLVLTFVIPDRRRR